MSHVWKTISQQEAEEHLLHGVTGSVWLTLFVASNFIIGPLLFLNFMRHGLAGMEKEITDFMTDPDWAVWRSTSWAVVLLVSSVSAYLGWRMYWRLNWTTIRLSIGWLWVHLLITSLFPFIVALIAFPTMDMVSAVADSMTWGEDGYDIIRGLLAAVVWTGYLTRSERVHVTYGQRVLIEPEDQPMPMPVAGPADSVASHSVPLKSVRSGHEDILDSPRARR